MSAVMLYLFRGWNSRFENQQILMTRLLTLLASVFHRHPLPSALHSPCKGVTIVSMWFSGTPGPQAKCNH